MPVRAPLQVRHGSVQSRRAEAGRDQERAVVVPGQRPEPAQETLISDPGDVVLSVTNLVKDFPVNKGLLQRRVASVSAVAGVSFEIRRGETFGLVGEAGCGKTTIGRLIVRMENPDAGTISFAGTDVRKAEGREFRRLCRRMQYMFQD